MQITHIVNFDKENSRWTAKKGRPPLPQRRMRTCTICQYSKPAADFYKKGTQCKECLHILYLQKSKAKKRYTKHHIIASSHAEYVRRYRKKNPTSGKDCCSCGNLKDKRSTKCKKCYNPTSALQNYHNQTNEKILLSGQRTCGICKKTKELNEFPKSKQNSLGIIAQCKDCTRQAKREYDKRERSNLTDRILKQRIYGKYRIPYSDIPQQILDNERLLIKASKIINQ